MRTSSLTSVINQNDTLMPAFINSAHAVFGDVEFENFEFKKNHLVYQEGMMPQGLFFIESGKVKIFKYGSDGKEQIIRIASAGDFLGYKELIGEMRYTSSASALEEVVVNHLPKEDFLYMLENDEHFKHQFTMRLCRDIIEAEAKIVNIAYTPVRGRLADALLTISTKTKESGESAEIDISRDDLARFIGTAKETVIRLLAEFKRENLIRTEGRLINVLDEKGLMRVRSLYN